MKTLEMPKKVKVFVLVNTLTSVNSHVYSNHIEFFAWTAKHHPEIDFQFLSPHRMGIDAARNSAADNALKLNADYLMFIDDDVLIPRHSLVKLIENDKDICAGLVIIRGMPFNVMAFKFTKKKLKDKREVGFFNEIPLKEKCRKGHKVFNFDCNPCSKVELRPLVSCDAVGFSLCLIKTSILKKLSPPYFVTGTGHTEDVYFCIKAKDELSQRDESLSIYMDTTLKCGHLMGQEAIAWQNRNAMRTYYDTINPMIESDGRGKSYFSRNLKLLK